MLSETDFAGKNRKLRREPALLRAISIFFELSTLALGLSGGCIISTALMLLVAVVTVSAIFSTTNRGRRWLGAMGVSNFRIKRIPAEDLEFLLDSCGRDTAEVKRRLEAERIRYPALDEAQIYRKAIRREIRGRRNPNGRFEARAIHEPMKEDK